MLGCGTKSPHFPQPVGDCSDVGPHYDPTVMGPTSRANYSLDCTCDTPVGCEVGDLTGKHDQIDVPGETASSRGNSRVGRAGVAATIVPVDGDYNLYTSIVAKCISPLHAHHSHSYSLRYWVILLHGLTT